MTFYVPSADHVEDVMRSKGYAVFDDPRGFDLNIFGVRTADTDSNKFNDWLCVMYLNDGIWNLFSFPATTDPGLYWRENPMNVNGTAMLKPGQYRSAYMLGEHKGYPALQQRTPLLVYRDADRDQYLEPDEDNVQEGMFGINIHRASAYAPSSEVNKWSAGCQVLQDPIHFEFLLNLVRASSKLYGNRFTYTLLTEADFGPLAG